MKYYSEILKKTFDTEKACLKAEHEYNAQVDAENARKAELAKQREARAKEVENAMKELNDAKKKYNEALTNFCKDYGTFHCSFSDANSIFEDFFKWF